MRMLLGRSGRDARVVLATLRWAPSQPVQVQILFMCVNKMVLKGQNLYRLISFQLKAFKLFDTPIKFYTRMALKESVF